MLESVLYVLLHSNPLALGICDHLFQLDFIQTFVHDDFVLVKVCNLRTPLKWGSCITQELCFQVTRDAFLCHVLSGFSTVLVSPNRLYT